MLACSLIIEYSVSALELRSMRVEHRKKETKGLPLLYAKCPYARPNETQDDLDCGVCPDYLMGFCPPIKSEQDVEKEQNGKA